MRDEADATMPPVARILGFAGLLPQLAVVAALALLPPEIGFPASALGYAYAALILSFLGGLWWGLAAASPRAPGWLYVAAVVPSLLALATVIPWAIGLAWPGPSLIVLGIAILATFLIDRRVAAAGLAPGWWLSLRRPLSVGLGGLTLIAGLLS
jgi:hypothetical protein